MTRFLSLCLLASSIAISATASTTTFPASNGAAITVDVYPAPGSAVRPAVVYLYGADAMALTPWNYPYLGNWFAAQGYDFYIVHYYDAGMLFNTWIHTISTAITWVIAQPGVDPARIYVMGLSLGGSLGVSVGNADPRVRASSIWSAGEASWPHPPITHQPPTIIIHGQLDPISPVASAYALQSLLASLNVPCELDIYPNEGHGFNAVDQNTALGQTLAFFQRF